MNFKARRATLLLTVMALACASTASAQVFGTFTWQMLPYCNKVTLTITQFPSGYTIDGFDDQCGAGQRAGAVGMVHINPDGSVGLNFTLIAAPSGRTVHISSPLSPATGSGAWTDNVGNSGTLALGANQPGLPPRPLPTAGVAPGSITSVEIAAGAVGSTQINTSQVQARVAGACVPGQSISSINADGTVGCVALPTRASVPCYSNTGNRYTDCGNGTVTDSVTGLIWLKDASCMGAQQWAGAHAAAATLASGSCGLSDGSFQGDWRMPTEAEWLATIAKGVTLGCTGANGPTLTDDTGLVCLKNGATSFLNVQPISYWSGTTFAASPGNGRYVDLLLGTTNDFAKTLFVPMWPVRGGPK